MKANLRLIREKRTKESTSGSLFINNNWFCYTIEDFDRDANKDGDLNDAGETKVYGETAIPSGVYTVKLSQSVRFKRLLPELLSVPGFEGIRIHRGNKAKDSHGCILVGYQRADDFIGTSAKCEEDLVKELQKYTEIEITIE